ncbi:hypothetical protein B4098_1667 [Heyndrickxia coagulans]|uniref:Uncharacterized protein n=1 Tax=Heyndrickxia coagulans TaxID=1398 RepID=A0A150K784_HEYCO|nr:hypothetical protein B4098_1667 [Heyndrickxia coagulans]
MEDKLRSRALFLTFLEGGLSFLDHPHCRPDHHAHTKFILGGMKNGSY